MADEFKFDLQRFADGGTKGGADDTADSTEGDKGGKKTVGGDVILIDIESLRDSLEFQDVLGYINTEEAQQMKGGSGHVK